MGLGIMCKQHYNTFILHSLKINLMQYENKVYSQKQSNSDSSRRNNQPFNQKQIRKGFVKKVFGIVFLQLLFSGLWVSVNVLSPGLATWQLQHSWIMYVFLVLNIILSCVLLCCQSVAKKVPINYILLFAFTFFQAYIISFVCNAVAYNSDMSYNQEGIKNILIALLGTIVISGLLTLFAWINCVDMTSWGFYLGMAGFFSMILIPLVMLYPEWHTFYSWLMMVLFCLYLAYDVQLVLGKGKNKLSQEDYIIGALIVYIDLVQIFMNLLAILSNN